jgi:hypothetical protein
MPHGLNHPTQPNDMGEEARAAFALVSAEPSRRKALQVSSLQGQWLGLEASIKLASREKVPREMGSSGGSVVGFSAHLIAACQAERHLTVLSEHAVFPCMHAVVRARTSRSWPASNVTARSHV